MTACALALVMLLDASGSISESDWALQRAGHAAALESAALTRAVERGGPIAVTALAFADAATPMLGWRVLRSAEDASRAAGALREAPRGIAGGTDIGGAIHAGLRALGEAPCHAEAEVIDLVTDGEANEVRTREARGYAEMQGVRINALGVGYAGAADWLLDNAVTPSRRVGSRCRSSAGRISGSRSGEKSPSKLPEFIEIT